ncbi:MAG: diaminopimelate decarboxylase [Anaerolineae bacterium]|nr:diaminopimelate decarboxylase [Anaerolineae bacterium]
MTSNKLSLFPLTTTVNQQTHIAINGHDTVDLAQQLGTPLYIYDVETIHHQIATYQKALAGYAGSHQLTYASKAFLCTAMVQLMAGAGVGLDVASAGEIFIAQHGGADPAAIHLHGNNKTSFDLSEALQAGVGRIVVDNAAEFERLAAMAAERNQPVNIWLRITPDVAVETVHAYTVTGTADSKFGFPLDQAEALAQQLLTDKNPWITLKGLHLHLGSHFHDAEPVSHALDRLLDLAAKLRDDAGWTLSELCAGGGWGVRYYPDDPPMPIKPFVTGIVTAIEQGCRTRNLPLPQLFLEPGRSLVAQAGVALYSVGGRKVIPDVRTYVSVDGGLADNPRPALYQAQYTALLANRANEPEMETVAVAGPFCESGDILIRAVDLPLANPGDIMAVPVAGAYQLSMSSNYNAALKPAVIFIDGSEVKLVQRRETFEDLVRRDAASL